MQLSIITKGIRRIKRKSRNFKNRWKPPFGKVSIESSYDKKIQNAYFYATKSNIPKPLIVSLHSWASNYKKPDPIISSNAVKNDWNYIHPDFRGVNNTPESVGSEMSMSDINDAIEYCIQNGNVDLDNIFIVGGSGGAYAALCFYSATNYKINSYIAWAPITDLIAWSNQTIIKETRHYKDIMNATNSIDNLDTKEARRRSPLYRAFPKTSSKFHLFSGYHDGSIRGPVPPTHTLDFYNKFAIKNGASGSSIFSKDDYIKILTREMLPTDKKVDDRPIIYSKKFKNISATVFVGAHDHLVNHSVELIHTNIKSYKEHLQEA